MKYYIGIWDHISHSGKHGGIMSRLFNARTNALAASGCSAEDLKRKFAGYKAADSAEDRSRILQDIRSMLSGCGVKNNGSETAAELRKKAEKIYDELPADSAAAAAGLWEKLRLTNDSNPSPADFISALLDNCTHPFYAYGDSIRLRLLKQMLAVVNVWSADAPSLKARFSREYADRDPAKIALIPESVFDSLENEISEAEDLTLYAQNYTALPPMDDKSKDELARVAEQVMPELGDVCRGFDGSATAFIAEKILPAASGDQLASSVVYNGDRQTFAVALIKFLRRQWKIASDYCAEVKGLERAMAAAEKETVPDYAMRFSRYIESISKYLLDPAIQLAFQSGFSSLVDVPEGKNAFEYISDVIGGDPEFNTVLNTLVSEFYNVNGLEESYSSAAGKGSFSRQKLIAEALKRENTELTEGSAAKIRATRYAGVVKENGDIDYVFLEKSAKVCDSELKAVFDNFKTALTDLIARSESLKNDLAAAVESYKSAKSQKEVAKKAPGKDLYEWLRFSSRLADPSAAWNTLSKEDIFILAFAFGLRFYRDAAAADHNRNRDVEHAVYLRYYRDNIADLTESVPVKREPDFADRDTAVYLYYLMCPQDQDPFSAEALRASGDRFLAAARMIGHLNAGGAGVCFPGAGRKEFLSAVFLPGSEEPVDPFTFEENVRRLYSSDAKTSAGTVRNQPVDNNALALRKIFCRRFFDFSEGAADVSKTDIVSKAVRLSGAAAGSGFAGLIAAVAADLFGGRELYSDSLTRNDVIAVYFTVFAKRVRYASPVSFSELCGKDFAPGLNAILSGCGFEKFDLDRIADAVAMVLVYVYVNGLYGDAPKPEKPAVSPAVKQEKKQPEKKAAPAPEKAAEAPAKTDEKAAEKPAEKPVENKTEKQVKKQPVKQEKKQPEKKAAPAPEKAAEAPAKTAEKAAAKPAEKPAANKTEKQVTKQPVKQEKKQPEKKAAPAPEKAAEAPAETAEKAAEKPAEKPVDNKAAKQVKKQPVKQEKKQPEKKAAPVPEKAAEAPAKTAEKSAEKPAENKAEKQVKKQPVKQEKKQPEKKAAPAPGKAAEAPAKPAEKPVVKPSDKPAPKKTEKQPEKKAAPAPEKKRTEAELIKTAKFGEKIVPASAKAAEKAPEPEAKPAPAQQAKRSMPEAETLKKFAFGEKITPKKEG